VEQPVDVFGQSGPGETMQLWPYLAGGAVALLAVTASAHAILTKRNVSSAVAWVGLIWLSPLIGAILYALLGINRIRRKATSARSGTPAYHETMAQARPVEELLKEALPPRHRYLVEIARLADRASDRPLLAGNRIDPLVDGDAAYPAMLAAIDAAERSVTLTTYIFDNDRAGRAFLDALRSAVARGVEVRVLIDDVGARYSFPSMVHTLRRAGVRVGRFMPAVMHWRMPYFNLRNHRKILVVDGRVGFTGGMNIRAASWLATQPSHPTRDLHFRVEGPVVAELQEVFAEDWAFSTGEKLEGPDWFPPLTARGASLARAISDGPDIDFEKLSTVILGALSTARSSVQILTPYFIPDQAIMTMLGVTAMRGVDVSIVLPEKSNLILVQWASTPHWGPLLEKGCRIFLTPPPFDHSKLMLVDGAWSLVGSANLDPRSLQLNFEFNIECYDPTLTRDLEQIVRERRSRAREVTPAELRARALPLQLRDGIARLASPYL
jgi:cardiolipin synthase A/B